MTLRLLAPILCLCLATLAGCAAMERVQAAHDVPAYMLVARYAPKIQGAHRIAADQAAIVLGVETFPLSPDYLSPAYADAHVGIGSLIFFRTIGNAFAMPGDRYVDALRIALRPADAPARSRTVTYRVYLVRPGTYTLGYFAFGEHQAENIGHFGQTAAYHGAWDKPVGFARSGGPAPYAPQFTVSAGETVYVGDFIFGNPQTRLIDGMIHIGGTCAEAGRAATALGGLEVTACRILPVSVAQENMIGLPFGSPAVTQTITP